MPDQAANFRPPPPVCDAQALAKPRPAKSAGQDSMGAGAVGHAARADHIARAPAVPQLTPVVSYDVPAFAWAAPPVAPVRARLPVFEQLCPAFVEQAC